MAISFSGRAARRSTSGYVILNLSANGSGESTPDPWRAGDTIVAIVRANKGLTGSSFETPSGFTLIGPQPSASGEPAHGLFLKRATTASDFSTQFRFGGWATTSGSDSVGMMTVVRGLDTANALWRTSTSPSGARAGFTDTLRPTVELLGSSAVASNTEDTPTLSGPSDWTHITSTNISTAGGDRIEISLKIRERLISESARVLPIEFSYSGQTTRNPRFTYASMRTSETNRQKPPTQPFGNVYVGDRPAKIHLNGSQIWE